VTRPETRFKDYEGKASFAILSLPLSRFYFENLYLGLCRA